MQDKSLFKKAIRLFFLLLLTNTIGYLAGSYMSPETVAWYHTLPLSPLTPPDYVFGIVWTILFFLMSISAFIVWGKVSPRWFAWQLMLNMLWSYSFFYLKSPEIAIIVLLAMLLCVLKTMQVFYRVSKISGLMWLPLILWSLFALYLNAYILL